MTLEREANGTLSSPGYPGDYPNNAHCVTIIRAPVTNHMIQINVTFIEMESYENCSFDSLTIFSTEHPGIEIGTFADENKRYVLKNTYLEFLIENKYKYM